MPLTVRDVVQAQRARYFWGTMLLGALYAHFAYDSMSQEQPQAARLLASGLVMAGVTLAARSVVTILALHFAIEMRADNELESQGTNRRGASHFIESIQEDREAQRVHMGLAAGLLAAARTVFLSSSIASYATNIRFEFVKLLLVAAGLYLGYKFVHDRSLKRKLDVEPDTSVEIQSPALGQVSH